MSYRSSAVAGALASGMQSASKTEQASPGKAQPPSERLPIKAESSSWGPVVCASGVNEPGPQISAEHGAWVPKEPPRALVVDDEESVRRVIARILGHCGFKVEQASGGVEALSRVKSSLFDVVFTDITMPNMGGVELLRALGKLDPDLPVVLLTGGPSLATAINAVELGAFQYLLKPFDVAKMKATALAAVEKGRENRSRSAALLRAQPPYEESLRRMRHVSFAQALDRLWIAFQPVVTSQDGKLFGYEALTRCEHPDLPDIGALLSAAEDLGGLHALGRRIRQRTTEAISRHPERGVLLLNLHPRDLADPQLLDAASPLGRMAHRTILEITERATLDGVGELQEILSGLRSMGFRIAVDDLGAGYAGFSSLATIRPDVVKIDMSLVRNIGADPVKRRLFRSIVEVSHDMGIQVVAEGIENKIEREVCVDLGADLLQGYLLGRPAWPFPEVVGTAASALGAS